jgi:G3E family GTPase
VPDAARAGAAREHAHERIRQYCLVREEPLDERTLALFLESLERAAGPNLLRVKGLVNVAGRPATLHGAQRLVHRIGWLEGWPDDDRRSRLVFLTLDVADDDIAALLASAERLVRKTHAAGRRAAGAAAAAP